MPSESDPKKNKPEPKVIAWHAAVTQVMYLTTLGVGALMIAWHAAVTQVVSLRLGTR